MHGPDSEAKPSTGSVLTLLALVGLYLAGLVFWEYFFDHGGILFASHDWPKEYKYYHVLRESISTGTIPYHTDQAEEFHGTQRFLGIPETNLSPQILLLPLMDTGRFIIVNVCILYTAGFIGLLLLRRRYGLSLLPFTFLFLLFNFNGTPTSHMAVGHSMWCGHFLMSFYVLYLLEMLEDASPTRPALKLAAVLFFIFLQGSFHYFVWCCMFLGLFLAFNRRLLKPGLLVLVFAGLLSAGRILPAAVAFWHDHSHAFLTGYPTLGDMIHGFVKIRHHDYRGIGMVYWRIEGWCEYDIYMSVPGFVLFVIFGVLLRFSKDPMVDDCRYKALDGPLAVQTLLSFSDVYAFIALMPIPLLNGERVSARFLIVPAMVILVLAAIRMQRVLERSPATTRTILQGGLAVMLVVTAFFLYQHGEEWGTASLRPESIAKWDAQDQALLTLNFADPVPLAGSYYVRMKKLDLSVFILELHDPLYIAVLYGSLLLSLATWGWWIHCYRRPAVAEAMCAAIENRVVGMLRREAVVKQTAEVAGEEKKVEA